MIFQDLKLFRVILELRYSEGFLYWDKCGEMFLDIQRKFPGWRGVSVSPELSKLENFHKNMEVEFNHRNIRFIQNEVDNLNQFKESTEKITPIIAEKFKIEKFRRIGNRYIFVFPLDNPEQGKKIVQDSTFVEIPKEKLSLFGKNSAKSSFAVYIENKDLNYRIELVGIERIDEARNIKINERFNPKYGLRVDVDIAIVNEVNVSDFNCSDFIQKNKKFLENNLLKIIQE